MTIPNHMAHLPLLLLLVFITVYPLVDGAEPTPDDLGTCWNYLKQPCNCGICSWFYMLEDVCKGKNLSHCVRGGYFDGGDHENDCCKADVGKMVIITVVVTAIVACWCCLVAAIIKIKRMQKRKRQRAAVDDVDIPMAGPGMATFTPGQYGDDADDMPAYEGGFATQVNTNVARTLTNERRDSNPAEFEDPMKPPKHVA